VPNTLSHLRAVVAELQGCGFRVAVFGGWAEELLELTPPRVHSDIDLLVLDADVEVLDAFVAAHGPIAAKRFSHKRAFISDGVLVELFLVHNGVSTFWDSVRFEWPQLELEHRADLPIAPTVALDGYRRSHGELHERTEPRAG
jgi:hypothetical protein